MPLISFFNFGDYFHAQRKKIIREAILKAANNLTRYSHGDTAMEKVLGAHG